MSRSSRHADRDRRIVGCVLKRILSLACLALPVAAWAFYKPVRVLTPWLNGVSCPSGNICTDAPSRYREASRLYEEAILYVDSTVGEIKHRPRVIFCATDACYRSFGFRRSAANTVATFGIVVSPRAWMPHFVRHEMIHHLQKERLGLLKSWLVTPQWFTEGMAYALSNDPRPTLAEPWQGYRSRFEAWYRLIGKERLWDEASGL